MALKTGSGKRNSNEETVDLSSLANLMKMVGDVTKEANDLEFNARLKDKSKTK